MVLGAFLGRAIRHLGSKVVHGASHALDKVKHIGKTIHEKVHHIPIVGQHLANGLEAIYNASPARRIVDGATQAVEVGKKLFSNDDRDKAEAMQKIRHIGARAMSGAYGSTAQSLANRGQEALNRISSALT